MTPGYIIFNSEGKAFWTEMERPEGTMESAHYYEWNKSLIPVVNGGVSYLHFAKFNTPYPLPEGTTFELVVYDNRPPSVRIILPKPKYNPKDHGEGQYPVKDTSGNIMYPPSFAPENGNVTGFSGEEVGTWGIDPATKDLKIIPHSFTEGTETMDDKERHEQTVESAYLNRMIRTLIDKWWLPHSQARDIGRDFFYTYVFPVYELGGQYGLKVNSPELTALKSENERLKKEIADLRDDLLDHNE